MTGFTFQSLKPQDSLSNELRSVIRDNVLQFYAKGLSTEAEEEGLTALYERLSQEDKLDGESNSIANQKKILERYCKDHGITAYRHYDEDDGYSGTNFNRPGFQRMLADIKAGRIKRVIVKDMSRFGRDYLQVGMYTDVVFPEFGVHFIAVNDGVDSTRGESEFTAIRNVFKNKVRSGKGICDFSFFRRFGIINRCFLRSCGMFAIRYRWPSAIGAAVAASAEM